MSNEKKYLNNCLPKNIVSASLVIFMAGIASSANAKCNTAIDRDEVHFIGDLKIFEAQMPTGIQLLTGDPSLHLGSSERVKKEFFRSLHNKTNGKRLEPLVGELVIKEEMINRSSAYQYWGVLVEPVDRQAASVIGRYFSTASGIYRQAFLHSIDAGNVKIAAKNFIAFDIARRANKYYMEQNPVLPVDKVIGLAAQAAANISGYSCEMLEESMVKIINPDLPPLAVMLERSAEASRHQYCLRRLDLWNVAGAWTLGCL